LRNDSIVAQSLCNRCVAQSLCNRCAINLQSLRNHFEIVAQSICNRCAINSRSSAIVLHRYVINLQSFRNQSAIVAQSICNRSGITLQLLRNHFAIAAQSLCNRCGINLQSLRNQFAIVAQMLRTHCAIDSQSLLIAAQSIRNHLPLTLQNRYAIDSKLLCNSFVIAFEFAFTIVSNRYSINLQSLRNRCDIKSKICDIPYSCAVTTLPECDRSKNTAISQRKPRCAN
jgi:hypothetical protein